MTSRTHSDNGARSLRSQSLDLLRFPLALVVMAIHIVASHDYYAGSRHVIVTRMDAADTFFAFFNAFLRGQSVPVYYFISGYVFFLGVTLTMDTYGHKLLNRTRSLLFPYLAWNILALGVMFIQFLPSLSGYFPYLDRYDISFTPQSILETFWNSWYGIFSRTEPFPAGAGIYPQDYPLWFVRDLMIIVLCAPLIYWSLRHTRSWLVIASGMAWFVLSPVPTGHVGQLLGGFFFFSWGAWMSYHHRDMIRDFRHFFKISAILYLIIGCVLMWLDQRVHHILWTYLKSINVFVGMVLAYGISSWLVERCKMKVSRFLAAASFFVYAGHGIFVAYVNIIYFNLFQPSTISGVASVYLLNMITTTGILLGLFYLTGRFFPTVQALFAGRRYPQRNIHN